MSHTADDKLPSGNEPDYLYFITALIFVFAFIGALLLLYYTTLQFEEVNLRLDKLENQTEYKRVILKLSESPEVFFDNATVTKNPGKK